MEWQTITWDAVATFVTGLAAVGAAWRIGIRQMNLTEQIQLDSKNQHKGNLFLQQQSLRSELLGRRANCIEKMRPFWSEYAVNGSLSIESVGQLKPVLWEAQLLFSTDVSRRLGDVIHSQMLSDHRRTTAEYYYKQGDGDTATKWRDRQFESEDAVYNAIWKLLDDMIAETRLVEFGA